jgi:hypothetical protein
MKLIFWSVVLGLSTFLAPVSALAKAAPLTSQETYALAKESKKSPTGATFIFIRDRETLTDYNLIISDGEEGIVSTSFSATQLEVIQSLLAEAKKFALTEEAVGMSKPLVTRFFDEQELEIVIDVMKFKNESHFFVTLQSEIGSLTVEAGNINRGKKTEEGFFSDMLLRVESELSKSRKLSGK